MDFYQAKQHFYDRFYFAYIKSYIIKCRFVLDTVKCLGGSFFLNIMYIVDYFIDHIDHKVHKPC